MCDNNLLQSIPPYMHGCVAGGVYIGLHIADIIEVIHTNTLTHYVFKKLIKKVGMYTQSSGGSTHTLSA